MARRESLQLSSRFSLPSGSLCLPLPSFSISFMLSLFTFPSSLLPLSESEQVFSPFSTPPLFLLPTPDKAPFR